MGKRSRKEKRRLLIAQRASSSSIVGGLMGALHRNSNGQATPQDIDMLARWRREQAGQDGYTGAAKSSSNGQLASTYTFHTVHTPVREDGVFHCEEAREVTDKCPLNPSVPAILIEGSMWECFLNCCKEYDTEWIALLIGKQGKDAKGELAYIIERFYFPPQTASGAHVDVPTGVKPKPGTIGAIHSHVGMSVFWSATDTAHSNWPVEIVINRKESYEALSRYKLKCGEWAKGKSEVRLVGSYVSKAVASQIDAAFAAGDILSKRSRATVPVSVHPDDKAEVAEAIVSVSRPAATFITGSACKNCNHWSSHTPRCSALDCKCDKYEPAGYSTPAEEVCSTTLCVRPKDHAGYHRTAAGEYFQYKPDESANEDKEEPQQLSLLSPKVMASSVQSDDPTDLSAEDYCQTCEGTSYVEGLVDGKLTAIDCPSCRNHPGLSDIGAIRQSEDMVH
jgi:proteasome lid subunit RPN8/RPN11